MSFEPLHVTGSPPIGELYLEGITTSLIGFCQSALLVFGNVIKRGLSCLIYYV